MPLNLNHADVTMDTPTIPLERMKSSLITKPLPGIISRSRSNIQAICAAIGSL